MVRDEAMPLISKTILFANTIPELAHKEGRMLWFYLIIAPRLVSDSSSTFVTVASPADEETDVVA